MAYEEAAISVPMMCMQCEEPCCMEVCPVGAIFRDEKDAVIINPDKCIGCKMCMNACPLGNIGFNTERRQVHKCDLCGGDPNVPSSVRQEPSLMRIRKRESTESVRLPTTLKMCLERRQKHDVWIYGTDYTE